MFPTLSYLIKYLTGLTIPLPIPTFGVLMCTAFIVAYNLFKSEFKRKEKIGILHPIIITTKEKKSFFRILFINTLIAFIIGYKLVYVLMHAGMFAANPQAILLSISGSWTGGFSAAVIVVCYTVYQHQKQFKGVIDQSTTITKTIHPYQLCDQLLFWCGVGGFTGTMLFAKLDYLPEIIANPSRELFAYHGMVFFGALIGGATGYFIVLAQYGIGFLVGADVGCPGMMAAYCIGRLGCHLSGDGDWGIVNKLSKPIWLSWLPESWWKNSYPHNVIHEGLLMKDCTDNYCNVLPAPVFPTSLYEFCICIFLFIFLWSIRKYLQKSGALFFVYITVFGIERYFIEFIRINPKYCFLQLCLSQAQWTSLAFIVAGITGLLILFLRRNPLVIGEGKSAQK